MFLFNEAKTRNNLTHQVSSSEYSAIASTPVNAASIPRIYSEVVAEREGPHVLVAVILLLEPCNSYPFLERLGETG